MKCRRAIETMTITTNHHMPNTPHRQRGVIDLPEGLGPVVKRETNSARAEPQSAPARVETVTEKSRLLRSRLGILIATAFFIVLLVTIAWAFRYEVIPLGIPQRGEFQYIVKDRWTSEIEIVWQRADGKIIRTSRHPFDASDQ